MIEPAKLCEAGAGRARTPVPPRSNLALQSQRLQRDIVRGIRPFLRAVDHAKAAAVVAGAVIPHVPADVVAFEGGAHVVQPASTVLRVGDYAEDAELVAGKRHVPVLCPFRSLAD